MVFTIYISLALIKKNGDKGALEIGSMDRSMLNTIFLDLHFPKYNIYSYLILSGIHWPNDPTGWDIFRSSQPSKGLKNELL